MTRPPDGGATHLVRRRRRNGGVASEGEEEEEEERSTTKRSEEALPPRDGCPSRAEGPRPGPAVSLKSSDARGGSAPQDRPTMGAMLR